jgi:hypothetical protein
MICLLLAASACKDDEPPIASELEPVPAPPPGVEVRPASVDDTGEIEGSETGEAAKVLPERPRADPDIERALDLVGASGLRFIDPPSEPDEAPDEYTAEQFASMLRTKWDWLGYDLTELQPWLDEIATRSFKTNRPYRVMHADGTTTEFRPWLDAQLAKPAQVQP